MRQILEHLAIKGINIPLENLSPVLLGLIRNNSLARKKDENKRYAYYKPNLSEEHTHKKESETR